MSVKFELPIAAIEPLFTALHTISPGKTSRLEMKAVGLLKNVLYYELEKMMETPEEKKERQLEFQKLFQAERERRNARVKESQERLHY